MPKTNENLNTPTPSKTKQNKNPWPGKLFLVKRRQWNRTEVEGTGVQFLTLNKHPHAYLPTEQSDELDGRDRCFAVNTSTGSQRELLASPRLSDAHSQLKAP